METILVSEKEPHMRQLLEWELEDSNYLCVCVDSTHGAKIALLLERIDAVVLGIGWPAADDLDTLRLLKKSFRDVPVVLFAAEEDLLPESFLRLADAWVEKSSRIDLLVSEVRKVISKFSHRAMA